MEFSGALHSVLAQRKYLQKDLRAPGTMKSHDNKGYFNSSTITLREMESLSKFEHKLS